MLELERARTVAERAGARAAIDAAELSRGRVQALERQAALVCGDHQYLDGGHRYHYSQGKPNQFTVVRHTGLAQG